MLQWRFHLLIRLVLAVQKNKVGFCFASFQWMYLIPLGLVVMNAVTQAMNMPEEQAAGQPGAQPQQTTAAALPRGQSATVRRR